MENEIEGSGNKFKGVEFKYKSSLHRLKALATRAFKRKRSDHGQDDSEGWIKTAELLEKQKREEQSKDN